MARQFNISNSNGFTSRNTTITNQEYENEFLKLHLGLNEARSQVVHPSHAIDFYQNFQNLIGSNQFGLSRRWENTIVTLSRMEVHRSIEYFPMNNSYPNEDIVTEVVRTTRYLTLTPNPIMEPRLFINTPNNTYMNIQPQVQNRNNLPNSSHHALISAPHINRIPPTNHSPSSVVIKNHVNAEGDGITHSLPHDKYGPYTCPRCHLVFSTSQKFAAHMRTHYKNESKDETRKRREIKYKNKYGNTNGASTSMMPVTNSNSEGDIFYNNNSKVIVSGGSKIVETICKKELENM